MSEEMDVKFHLMASTHFKPIFLLLITEKGVSHLPIKKLIFLLIQNFFQLL